MGETPTPDPKDMGINPSTETPGQNRESEFFSSPDYFVFNAGHAEHIRGALPGLFETNVDGRQPATNLPFTDRMGAEKNLMPVRVHDLAKYLDENHNQSVSDSNGRQVDALSYVTDLMKVELRQQIGPNRLIPRLDSVSNGDKDTTVEQIADAYRYIPGQLAAVIELQHDETYKNVISGYLEEHTIPGEDGSTLDEKAEAFQKSLEEIDHTMADTIEGFLEVTPDQKAKLQENNIPPLEPSIKAKFENYLDELEG